MKQQAPILRLDLLLSLMPAHPSIFQQIRSFNRPARLFLIATVMDGVIFSAWSLFFNFYMLERGFSREFLGLATSTNSAAALLVGLPIGVLSDRLGRKRAMLIGVAMFIIANALEVTLLQPAWILAAAFFAGIGNMLFFLNHAPFMMQVSNDDNRTLLFSLNYGLLTLSGAVGSLFAGQLPELFGGWLNAPAKSAQAYQAVLLASVALGATTLIPLALIRQPPALPPPAYSESPSSRPKTSTWRVVTQKLTLQLALPNLLIGFGAAILIPYMNVFFRDKFTISDQRLGILFSVSALLTGLGSLVGPRLALNVGGKIRAVVITQGLSLIFLLVVGFSPSLWIAAAGFLLRGMLMNMASPLYSTFAMEQVRETERATVNRIKEMAWTIGWSVGPYISGLVQERYRFTPLFLTTAVLYGFSIAITWHLFSSRERKSKQAVVLS